MEWLKKLIDYYLNNHKELTKWRKRVSVMAAVVVFITTYALILPAITVDKDTSTPERGMYLESGTEATAEENTGEEKKNEDQADASAGLKAGKEAEEKEESGDNSKKDSKSEEQSAEKAEEESKAKVGSETENIGDEAEDEIQDEKGMDAGQESSGRKLETSNALYSISLSYNKQAKIPEGAVLRVREAKEGSKTYSEYLEKAKKALLKDKEGKEISGMEIRFFDISIRDKGRLI